MTRTGRHGKQGSIARGVVTRGRGHVALSAVLVAAWSVAVGAATTGDPLPLYEIVIGDEVEHAVVAGETLGQIARRFGVRPQVVATFNRVAKPEQLRSGQRLRVSNRRIVPAHVVDGLVINAAELKMYWVQGGTVAAEFPVALGRRGWETPGGQYTIMGRRRDPVWYVPPSIQREMKEKGQVVRDRVPAGPNNPLGKYWLQLSAPGYGIHGTNAPWTVGRFSTHGCVRLRARDIEWLYKNVPDGTTVDIVDEPLKIARLHDRILLEAHAGSRKRGAPSLDTIMERLRASEIGALIDHDEAQRAVRDALGVAVDVTSPHASDLAGR